MIMRGLWQASMVGSTFEVGRASTRSTGMFLFVLADFPGMNSHTVGDSKPCVAPGQRTFSQRKFFRHRHEVGAPVCLQESLLPKPFSVCGHALERCNCGSEEALPAASEPPFPLSALSSMGKPLLPRPSMEKGEGRHWIPTQCRATT